MIEGVKIELRGCAGSGKTAILHIIGKALADAGMNVEAIDEGNKISKFEPILPRSPDARRVSISC